MMYDRETWMSSTNPKRALFVEFAGVAKCLAHAHRLELVEQLAQGERSVEILAAKTGLSIANASQHLQQMRRAGIISARRDGKFVFYRLADEAVAALRTRGFKARRLEDGFPEWRAAGLPVETSLGH